MIFEIQCNNPVNGEQLTLKYNNETSELYYDSGEAVAPQYPSRDTRTEPYTMSPENPVGKSRTPDVLKIQMGLSCNYECSYCSQRFVPRSVETNPDSIREFIEMLERNVTLPTDQSLKIEFWGGEPFVYWKTLKPLAEILRQKYPNARMSIVNNGSLLTFEKVDWMIENRIGMAVSHDGPNMEFRGPDPLKDPKQAEVIRYAFNKYKEAGLIFSFNSMLHAKNYNRQAIIQYFEDFLGTTQFGIGEGGIVDAYDADAEALSFNTKASQFEYRRSSMNEFCTEDMSRFTVVGNKVNQFIQSVSEGRKLATLGQKCGMDREDSIAVNLNGEVLTCQNTSSVSTNPAGVSHKIGHLDDYDNIKLNTSTHHSQRSHCWSCPVVQLCGGSCMFLSGKLFDVSCNNAFSENIVYMAYAIYKMTGHIPTYIHNENLPAERRDIWGTILEHKEKKAFPVKVVAA